MSLYNRIAYVEITTQSNVTLRITDLRIVFNITKTEGKDPNTANIEIYNLSELTRNRIRDLGKQVTVFAGYKDENGPELIFAGDITNISHSIVKPEVVTSITANDGKTPVNKAKLVISQNGVTSGRGILERVLGAFDIGNNLNQINFENVYYQSGFSFAGSAKDALDKVTEFLDLSWSVQNNEIKLVTFDGNDRTGVILLSSESGLIRSPERLSGDARKSKNKTKKDSPGWRFESLLFPSINPLGRIAVQSVEIPRASEFTVFLCRIQAIHTGRIGIVLLRYMNNMTAGTSTLDEVLSTKIKRYFDDVHTCIPGRFEKYDYKTQSAQVKPLIKKVYLDGSVLVLPVIASVPVIFPRTAQSGITFPINKGDKCLILFTERSLERWRLSGNDSEPGDRRRYDLSDAVAIPGLFSLVETNIQSNNEDLEIHHKEQKVTIKSNGDIQIGVDSIKKLVTEEFKSIYEGHTHAYFDTLTSLPLVTTGPRNTLGTVPGTPPASPVPYIPDFNSEVKLTVKTRAE
ncbi:MAG: hypothetical protein HC773_05165 [Scytonema sp. CRU_2_7]|nr:hypothetical protein [Scytonema sp. CRU_2_7]